MRSSIKVQKPPHEKPKVQKPVGRRSMLARGFGIIIFQKQFHICIGVATKETDQSL